MICNLFIPIEGLFNDLKHLSQDSDVSQIGAKHELDSEDNEKRIRKKNFKSSTENELDEAPFLKSRCYIVQKRSKSIEPNHKGVQSYIKYTTGEYKKCLGKVKNLWNKLFLQK